MGMGSGMGVATVKAVRTNGQAVRQTPPYCPSNQTSASASVMKETVGTGLGK